MRILEDDCHGLTQVVPFDPADGMTVYRDFSRPDIEEAGEHVQDGCFSGSGGTDQGYFAAGFCMQGDSFQNRFLRFVSEINVFHGYVALYIL